MKGQVSDHHEGRWHGKKEENHEKGNGANQRRLLVRAWARLGRKSGEEGCEWPRKQRNPRNG